MGWLLAQVALEVLSLRAPRLHLFSAYGLFRSMPGTPGPHNRRGLRGRTRKQTAIISNVIGNLHGCAVIDALRKGNFFQS